MSFTLPTYTLSLPFDADPTIKELFALEAELNCAIKFERALSSAQGKLGIIPERHAQQIVETLKTIKIDAPLLFDGVSKDGIYVPAFVKQIREGLPIDVGANFHKDTTSQDVIDTSLILRLKSAVAAFHSEIAELINVLETLKTKIGDKPISARTRMQAALPFTLGDRMDNWLDPLISLKNEKPAYFPVQLGGPIGMMHKREKKWPELIGLMAEGLDLSSISKPWHTDRRPIVNLCVWLTEITTCLGKFGADVTLMVQNGIDEISLNEGGSSSAMPHKKNPILAETLVSGAQYNAGQMGLLHSASLHEHERSGISWTMEFMIVPMMVLTCSAGLKNARRLASQLDQ